MNRQHLALLCVSLVFLAACSVEPIRPVDTYERAQRFNDWWGRN
jgi:hypothetical protein